jgi:two-component system, cell cycle response regulator
MRVLIAEGDGVSRKILEASVRRWGHDAIPVDDGFKAWEALCGEDPPRAAVIDSMTPGMDGVEICRRLRARENQPFTFVLVLTADDHPDDIVAALNAGADDYLTKPYHPKELQSRLGAGIRLVNLTMQLEEANQKLYEAAHTDLLTRLPNRIAILERFKEEISSSRGSGTAFVLALGAIDRFKTFNDKFGYQTGDCVLKSVARRLASMKRRYDCVGRYDGAAFLLVLSDVGKDHVYSVADRFRQCVADQPVDDDGQLLDVTMSLGALWVPPSIDTDVDLLLSEADQLLYRAKTEGRNRTCFDHADQVFGQPQVQSA